MEPRAKTYNASEVPKPRKYMPPPPPRLEMSMTKLPNGTCRYVRVVPTAPASQPGMVSRVKKQGRQWKCRCILKTSVAANPAVPSPKIASPLEVIGSYGDDGFAGGVDPVGTLTPLDAIASPLAVMRSGDDGFAGGVDPIGTFTPLDAINALGSRQNSFIPYAVKVKPGQDVSTILSSFGQNGHVSVLSANGVVSQVELHQAATSNGVITYEGRFEILRLTGLLSEAGGLRVLLAGPNCQVFGGHLAGIMIAASPVQVILGSFTADNF